MQDVRSCGCNTGIADRLPTSSWARLEALFQIGVARLLILRSLYKRYVSFVRCIVVIKAESVSMLILLSKANRLQPRSTSLGTFQCRIHLEKYKTIKGQFSSPDTETKHRVLPLTANSYLPF